MALGLLLLAPCPAEDSAGCTWYATAQGTPGGHSFISPAEGIALYLD